MKLISLNKIPVTPGTHMPGFRFLVCSDGLDFRVMGYGFSAALGGATFEHLLYIEFHSPSGIVEVLIPGEPKAPRH